MRDRSQNESAQNYSSHNDDGAPIDYSQSLIGRTTKDLAASRIKEDIVNDWRTFRETVRDTVAKAGATDNSMAMSNRDNTNYRSFLGKPYPAQEESYAHKLHKLRQEQQWKLVQQQNALERISTSRNQTFASNRGSSPVLQTHQDEVRGIAKLHASGLIRPSSAIG